MSSLLWLASGAINGAVVWNGILGGSIGGIFPATVPGFVWARTPLWVALAVVVGLLAVAAVHRFVTRIVGPTNSRRVLFVIIWFASVVAGVLVGLASDAATIIDALPPGRMQMLFDGLGTQAGIGAYWGLLQGWIPAIVVALLARRHRRVPGASGSDAEPGARGLRIIAALSVVALVSVVGVGVAGLRDGRRADAQQEAIANGFDESSGAFPDPNAEGNPVATVAPDVDQPSADWCTPDQAMLLLGDESAATGHRMYSVTLMNFSDAPCVVEGYPDFAFADQNDHALDVIIKRGGSFMAQDPGAQRIEIPAQGSAITYLGWDAASTAGELVATKLYGAQYAGELRGSWPVSIDVVKGSTVAVTAWALKPTDATGTP